LAASHKIRAGLIELRNSGGSAYARPSFWERVYLLWMFRNFHCLPKEVLHHHQRKLVDKLCQTAVHQRSIAPTDIIGIVENVHFVASKRDLAPAASNVIEMVSSTVEVTRPRAVAAGGTRVRWNPPVDQDDGVAFAGPSAKVEAIAPPKAPLPVNAQEKEPSAPVASRKSSFARAAWILAGTFAVAAIALLLRFQTFKPPAVPSVPQPTAAMATPVPATPPATTALLPPQPSVIADQAPPATIPESTPSQPAVSSPQSASAPAAAPVATVPTVPEAVETADASSEPRLQLAQPPESGFRYPVAPSATLMGKVNLRAVIGTDGAVRRVDVISGNRALAAAAVRAVQHWRYAAPEMNGHPVEAETNIAINFVGDDAVSISFPSAQ